MKRGLLCALPLLAAFGGSGCQSCRGGAPNEAPNIATPEPTRARTDSTHEAPPREIGSLQAPTACPPLATERDDAAIVAALRCMVESDQRALFADHVKYPLEVLLSTGAVRTLKGPSELLSVYDDVIDADVRASLRRGEVLNSYWGVLIGRTGPLVEEGKIHALFKLDAEAHRKLGERLSGEERRLWRARPRDILCRTKRATHVFSDDADAAGYRRFQLATWNDPKAVLTRTPPNRMLFGVLEMHGTCGNNDYRFVGPGADIGFHHVVCYGPGPTPEYFVTIDGVEEACVNHPVLK